MPLKSQGPPFGESKLVGQKMKSSPFLRRTWSHDYGAVIMTKIDGYDVKIV